MTIAVDFDGTLCENKWPDIGQPNVPIINELIRRQEQGDKLILWTCREGMMLDRAVMWCINQGLRFDAINENTEELKELFGNDCRKVGADEYWDDKSVIITSGSSPGIMRKDGWCYQEAFWTEQPSKANHGILDFLKKKVKHR